MARCMDLHSLIHEPQQKIEVRLGITHYVPSALPTDGCSSLPEIVRLSPSLPPVLADMVAAYL